MSHNSSAARSSRLPPRYSPYFRSSISASSTRRLPPPSAPLSGHGAGGPSSSDNCLSPAHAYDTNSVIEYSAAALSLNYQPNYVIPSTSTHHLNYSTNHAYSFPSPLAAPLTQTPFSQVPYHPAPLTNPRHPAPIYPPSNVQPVQPFITLHPSDSTYPNYAIHQHPPRIHPVQTTQRGQSYYGNGMFKESRDFSVTNSTFIDNSISESSDNFMKEFLRHTIIGAEYDSSDRHPPPRCHPGTRLAIIERCKIFIVQCDGEEKMRWVVGPAGVGKSAIMQMIAEEVPGDASVFFSVNGRNDGTKFFATIAYQLAVKYEPYRQFIRNEINRDPSLLRKSLPAQFRKFIVDPFIHQHLFNDSQRFLIIIDGLDECDNSLAQREILGLISYFCVKHSTSSVVWIVASRPEPHITSFFDDARVTSAYTKEEVEIDSDEACEDVQQYLRDELSKIKLAYPTLRHKREWPSELEFTKIATAAGGLFAYASTVVRYIGDCHYRDPVAQLRRVFEVIDEGLKDDVSRKDHPMALLDALYRRILSNIPPDVMIYTRKLLLTTWWLGVMSSTSDSLQRGKFRYHCNMLGLSVTAAYGAVSYLHAVLKVPAPDNADDENIEYFHKSFPDFLLDFKRSGFSRDAKDETDQLRAQCSLRIVTQVSDDFVDSRKVKLDNYGYLRGCLGFCDDISLSWTSDEHFRVSDAELRHTLYCSSMADICNNFSWSLSHSSISFFHALTTRFSAPGLDFPIYSLRDRAFEQFRPELTELGKLMEVPLRTLDYAAICGMIDIWFTSPIGTDTKDFDRWNLSCNHLYLDVDGLPQQRVRATHFWRRLVDDSGDDMTHVNIPRFNIMASKYSHRGIGHHRSGECLYCSRRLAHHFIDHPDQLATVFVDATEMSYVELKFVDADGVSEWIYRFLHSGRPSGID